MSTSEETAGPSSQEASSNDVDDNNRDENSAEGLLFSPPSIPPTYLQAANCSYDFKNLRRVVDPKDFEGLQRISEEVLFCNGVMNELISELKGCLLGPDLFFEFVKAVVPLCIFQEIKEQMPRQFNDKISRFEKLCQSKRKRTKTYKEFLAEAYNFMLTEKQKKAAIEGQRKRRETIKEAAETEKKICSVEARFKEATIENQNLSSQLHQLKSEKLELESQLQLMGEEKNQLKSEKLELETMLELEVEKRSEEVASLKKTIQSLSQTIKGMKSGKVRKRDSEEGDIDEHREHDTIQVVDKQEESFQGIRFFRTDSGFERTTDGKIRTYFEIPYSDKKCSESSQRELYRRAHLVENFVEKVSHNEKKILFTEVVKLNKDLLKEGLKEAGINMVDTMSTRDAVAIQSLLRLPTNKMRNLRVCLNNLRINIFPSERKMRKEKRPLTSHVDEDSIETGFIGLQKTKNDEGVKACPYLKVKCLKSFLEDIISKDAYGFNHGEGFDGNWWFLFSGDKGGHHMKYCVEIINSNNAGSVDNVHIYAIFEAQDSPENMMKVWYPTYYQQIKEMQDAGFTMDDGRKVVIFLGGDYHFIDDNLGHQGSSASYPSAFDKVTRDHLKDHPPCPHTPEHCNIEIRTVTDFIENYNENLVDDRNNGDMRLNGKHHLSVCGPMIFPIYSLDQVVPPLHIMLGIVLLLYNKLLKECQKADEDAACRLQQSLEKEAINQEWEMGNPLNWKNWNKSYVGMVKTSS